MKHKKKTTMAEDRISNLPDSTMHDILSFLDMKQVVQTSILSSKWRTLWKSTPDLNFNRDLWFRDPYASNSRNPYASKTYRKDKVMDFVDRVLLLRDCSSIRKFRLSRFNHHPDLGRVVAWLIHASKLGVKHVDLEISLSEPYVLPALLFTSQVTVLRLNGLIQLTKQINLSLRLQVLKLESVQLPQVDKNEEFEFSSPVLRWLILIDCNVKNLNALKISAPQLRKLLIKNQRSSVCSCVLKICTPRLASLKLYGAFYKDYQFEKLLCLVSCLVEGFCYGQWLLHTESLMKVLSGVSSVETLEIHGFCLKVNPSYNPVSSGGEFGPCNSVQQSWTGMMQPREERQKCLHEILRLQRQKDQLFHQNQLGSWSFHSNVKTLSPPENIFDFDNLLSPFMRLRCLKLVGFVGGSCTQAVSNLLKNTPSIESLVWDASQAPYGEEEDWEEVLSFENKFYHMKSISAQNLKHTKVELKFLEFLLRNAFVLEKITILFPKDPYPMGQQDMLDKIKLKKEREELMKKVQSLPKARTSARMAFIIDGKPLCVPEFV